MKRQEVILYEVPDKEYGELKKELERHGFTINHYPESLMNSKEYFAISMNTELLAAFEYRTHSNEKSLFWGHIKPNTSLDRVLSEMINRDLSKKSVQSS